MAASKYLNNAQLRMFIPAKELMNETVSLETGGVPMGKSDWLVNAKGADNSELRYNPNVQRHERFSDTIAREGVKGPVSLALQHKSLKPAVVDGHHRILAAYDSNPNMEVPVKYGYDYEQTGVSFPPSLYARTKSEEAADAKYFAPKGIKKKK